LRCINKINNPGVSIMRLFFLVLSLLIFTTVGAQNKPTSNRAQEIKIYQVPEGHTDEIISVLHTMLSHHLEGSGGLGKVSRMSNNQVAVVTTPSLQSDISQLIAQTNKLPPFKAKRVRLSYWLVRASEQITTAYPKNLEPLKAALSNTQDILSGYGFERADFAQQVLLSGEKGSLNGAKLGGDVQVTVNDQRISLRLSLVHNRRSSMQTNIDLFNDETIVLAQMGSEDDSEDTLLFVVKAEIF